MTQRESGRGRGGQERSDAAGGGSSSQSFQAGTQHVAPVLANALHFHLSVIDPPALPGGTIVLQYSPNVKGNMSTPSSAGPKPRGVVLEEGGGGVLEAFLYFSSGRVYA